jgi:hypothetical protein
MFVPIERALRVTAWLACAAVVAMIAIFLTTGVGQDALQFVHPADQYARILLKNPAALRACIGLDNFFIVFYSTVFVTLGILLLRSGSPRPLVLVAVGLLLLLSFLDMIENFHFLTMLAVAEQGGAPSAAEIQGQAWESLLKFHVGYLGLFLLGFALPQRTRAQRALARLSWFVQLPVGLLIYVTPHAVSVPLVFVRFGYFLAALILAGEGFGRTGEPPAVSALAAVGSSAPA